MQPSLMLLFVVVGISSALIPKPLPYQLWAGKRVMMIAAHPDDVEGTSAGLVALLQEQGTEVRYVIITNGDKGCGNPFCEEYSPEEIAVARMGEAYAGAGVVNVNNSNVVFLGYEDGMMTSYPEEVLRKRLVREMRRFRPTVVMTWRPYPDLAMQPSAGWNDLGYHPDHQDTGRLVMAAWFQAPGRSFPDVGQPWRVSELYFWDFLTPHFYVSLDERTLDKKVAAFAAHKSQYDNYTAFEEEVVGVCKMVGDSIPDADAKFAEGFVPYF